MIKKAYELYASKYGNNAQIIKAIEEMSELTKELSKHLLKDGNRTNIIDEIADVNIMMTQLIMIFDCKSEVLEKIDFKVKRMLDRLK